MSTPAVFLDAFHLKFGEDVSHKVFSSDAERGQALADLEAQVAPLSIEDGCFYWFDGDVLRALIPA